MHGLARGLLVETQLEPAHHLGEDLLDLGVERLGMCGSKGDNAPQPPLVHDLEAQERREAAGQVRRFRRAARAQVRPEAGAQSALARIRGRRPALVALQAVDDEGVQIEPSFSQQRGRQARQEVVERAELEE